MKNKYVASKMGVVREGVPFILGFGFVGFLWSPIAGFRWLAVVSVGLSIFSIYFFRDPQRRIPKGDSLIIAPADGRIMEISEEDCPYWPGPAKVVKIFLSVIDVHLQRAPIQGKIIENIYKKGKFLDARDPRASFENESNAIVIETKFGKIVVKQIAGLIARRIISWVEPELQVAAGEHIGLIRFGSQVDLFLPMDLEVNARPGDVVVGGETVIAGKK